MKETSGDQQALRSRRSLKGQTGRLHSRKLIWGDLGCSYFTPEVIVPPNALPAIFQVVLIIYKLTYIAISPLSGPGLVKSCAESREITRCGLCSREPYLAKTRGWKTKK